MVNDEELNLVELESFCYLGCTGQSQAWIHASHRNLICTLSDFDLLK